MCTLEPAPPHLWQFLPGAFMESWLSRTLPGCSAAAAEAVPSSSIVAPSAASLAMGHSTQRHLVVLPKRRVENTTSCRCGGMQEPAGRPVRTSSLLKE